MCVCARATVHVRGIGGDRERWLVIFSKGGEVAKRYVWVA